VSVRSRRLLVIAIAGTLAAGLSGCGPLTDASPDAQAPADAGAVSAELDALPVAAWAAMTGYTRDRFKTWDAQGNGCDTRDRVLQRDGQNVVTGNDCTITSGTWVSPYDGKTLTDPSGLDIDHMVPLANARRTGAAAWTDEQREQFANDLTRPQLLAVDASANRSKGDQDPSQWKPPAHEYWCTYAQRWIAVKTYWRLWVTADEKTALGQMLATCS
jgi:hypothetical protein